MRLSSGDSLRRDAGLSRRAKPARFRASLPSPFGRGTVPAPPSGRERSLRSDQQNCGGVARSCNSGRYLERAPGLLGGSGNTPCASFSYCFSHPRSPYLRFENSDGWRGGALRWTSGRGLRESAGGSRGRLPPGPRKASGIRGGEVQEGELAPPPHGGMGGAKSSRRHCRDRTRPTLPPRNASVILSACRSSRSADTTARSSKST